MSETTSTIPAPDGRQRVVLIVASLDRLLGQVLRLKAMYQTVNAILPLADVTDGDILPEVDALAQSLSDLLSDVDISELQRWLKVAKK